MKTSLIQKIKNRAKSEKISFDAAAEKYFFEASPCSKKIQGVYTPANVRAVPLSKLKKFF